MSFTEFRELTKQYITQNALAQGFFNKDHSRQNFRENCFGNFVREAREIGSVKSPLSNKMMALYAKYLTTEAYNEVVKIKDKLDGIKTELKDKYGEDYQNLYTLKYSTLSNDIARNEIGCGEVDIEVGNNLMGKYYFGNLILNKNDKYLKWELDAYLQCESEDGFEKTLKDGQYDKITIRIPVLYYVSEDGIWTGGNQMNNDFYWSQMFNLFELEHQDEFKDNLKADN